MLNAQYTASNKYTVISKKYRHIIMDKKNFKNEVLSNVNCSICIFLVGMVKQSEIYHYELIDSEHFT